MFGKTKRQILRVLVVEDEPLVAFDTEYLLSTEGFTVVATTDSVTEAIGHLTADARVDLVLLDLTLRDGNGETVAQAAAASDVPVLLVTGRAPELVPPLGVGCLAKPYRPRDLIVAIDICDRVLQGAGPRRLPKGLRLFHSVPQ